MYIGQMFQVEMLTHNEYITNRSMVTGFEWKGNIDIKKLTAERASDAILEFLSKNPEMFYTSSSIISALCSEELGEEALGNRLVGTTITQMRGRGELDYCGSGIKNDPYTYKYPTNIVDKLLSKNVDNHETE